MVNCIVYGVQSVCILDCCTTSCYGYITEHDRVIDIAVSPKNTEMRKVGLVPHVVTNGHHLWCILSSRCTVREALGWLKKKDQDMNLERRRKMRKPLPGLLLSRNNYYATL